MVFAVNISQGLQHLTNLWVFGSAHHGETARGNMGRNRVRHSHKGTKRALDQCRSPANEPPTIITLPQLNGINRRFAEGGWNRMNNDVGTGGKLLQNLSHRFAA